MPVNHRQAIVVGAGPVGLTIAINMAKLGIDVLVLKRGPGIGQSPQATSYQACVLAEIVEQAFMKDVKKKSFANDVLSFWVPDGTKKRRAAYASKKDGGKHFPTGLNCGQPILTTTIYFSNKKLTLYHKRTPQ